MGKFFGPHATKATYMCHKGIVDGGLWVTGPARLHRLPLHLRVGCCRLPIVVLEAWAGLLLWWRMVQDSCHTQLHLEVQKVIPGVFEEQILLEREMCSWVTCDMLQSGADNKQRYVYWATPWTVNSYPVIPIWRLWSTDNKHFSAVICDQKYTKVMRDVSGSLQWTHVVDPG